MPGRTPRLVLRPGRGLDRHRVGARDRQVVGEIAPALAVRIRTTD